jgi:peptidoglycan hydrolase-like protein with peptidoglycan-binding domain
MTGLRMADSIFVDNLPAGYDCYLGYADGKWPTAAALRAKFPGKPVISLTVFGGATVADGCDIEAGDLTTVEGAEWASWRLATAPAEKPVLYASASRVADLITELAGLGIDRSRVRILSAHYAGSHICGPGACSFPAADGTQWTDAAEGLHGSQVDESLLSAGFLGAVPQPAPQPTWEAIVALVPAVKLSDTGQGVKNWQGLCGAHGHPVAIDGDFGEKTHVATLAVQKAAGVTADGLVGPKTWTAALS